ncbi:MAG TPA: EVE domain-containing protein [Myxococcota bacterium]|jgi:predicted RNA-binding protein with PUA-like domain
MSKAAQRPRSEAKPSGVHQSWLVKSDPDSYGWEDLVKDGGTRWDGVRNAEARNSLGAMRAGERVLFYHSGGDKAVVGIAKVKKAAYPEPGADDPRWLAVDLAPLEPLPQPVTLAAIKAERSLAKIRLVTHSRLSVMPIEADAFERILSLASKAAKRPRSEPQASEGGPPQGWRPRRK